MIEWLVTYLVLDRIEKSLSNKTNNILIPVDEDAETIDIDYEEIR